MFPALYVTKFTLVGIALTLKGDGSVSLVPVSDHQQPDDKLYHVEQVEPDNQQFFLLLPMNVLVIDVLITHHESFTDEYQVEQCDSLVAFRRKDMVLYDLHAFASICFSMTSLIASITQGVHICANCLMIPISLSL